MFFTFHHYGKVIPIPASAFSDFLHSSHRFTTVHFYGASPTMHDQQQKAFKEIQSALDRLQCEPSEHATEQLQELLVHSINNSTQLQQLIHQLQSKLSACEHEPSNENEKYDRQPVQTRSLSQTELAADFRLALQRQELFLCYQPIVLLTTGKLKGVEALARWRHPTRGIISPTEFIPLAETTGLIVPLTQWVLQEACTQLRKWQQQFPSTPLLTVSVNISPQHLAQAPLIKDIQTTLQQTGLPSISLKLEITESAVIQQPTVATQMLHQLREMDVQTYLDDFGTGHSSLAYLCHFPIDTLKLDRTFITSITTKPNSLHIVHSILRMAWKLGMNVVAEGIETRAQLKYLRTLKCDYGQGYYFSPPVTAQSLEKNWLKSPPYCL